jgi:hypothetical protein
MMSLLRIICGVLIGIGFIIGLVFLAGEFPTAAGRIWFMILTFGSGGLFLWFVVRGLRLGVTTVGRSARYERSVSPFHFWFYILFYLVVGALLLVVGAYSILAPDLLSSK